MRVLQLIDSLQTGGAERVAVNIANALVSKIEMSCLCATREEGLLKKSIDNKVNYLFLNKKKTLDFKAVRRLNSFVRQNEIDIIHAHSTSFFLATIIKLLNTKVKIVWHDHYGDSAFLENRSFSMLKKCSVYFSHIFSVNKPLEAWAKTNLKCNQVMYLQNFAVENTNKAITTLKGEHGKRIIHLANLRAQKDHNTLLDAFKVVNENYPDWTLHCVGKDFNDNYSEAIQNKIKTLHLDKQVFTYGSVPDVSNILSQSTIAVLPSKSEGLPIALLEYGLAGLPVVVSDVGNCKEVVANEELGQLIPSENTLALRQAIIYYISDLESAKAIGLNLKAHVETCFSEHAVAQIIIDKYRQLS